ncbi:MAG: hypothetical protein KJ907_06105 [Actinobacteria bacterium]|nr:hypothetical protein [Actinomycetota bacterium]
MPIIRCGEPGYSNGKEFTMQGTFSRSWQLTKESFEVLKTDKHLVVFPIISGIATIILFALLMVPAAFLSGLVAGNTDNTYVFYVFFFIYYFAASFVVIFFNTALIACVQIRFRGGEPTFRDGIDCAYGNIGKIFAWSAINASVGLVLRMIRERAGILGSIVAGIIGIAWNLITFFVIPVIIFEGLGAIDSIKRSTSIFRKTWGENMVLRFSVGLIFFLLGLVGIIPIVLAALTKTAVVIIPVVGLVIIYWVVLAVIAAALNGVFATALYDFAVTGQVPRVFSPNVIQGAFSQKTRRFFR